MKAPAFAYAKPPTLAEAYTLLDADGGDAKVLAGGQSLMPALNMRLSAPKLLVDINAIPGLTGIACVGDTLRIGALTRHREIERSTEVARQLPLLAQAMPHVAHVAIRNSGTIGGSLAYADPAAEIPAVAVALDAQILVGSSAGQRRIGARQFFRGLYDTALAVNEIILAVEFPLTPGYVSAFMELARRHGDYAVIGVAAHARPSGQQLDDVRLVFLGGNPSPRLAENAARALIGRQRDAESIESAVAALAMDLDPLADLYHRRDTKMHLAGVVLRRALAQLKN
jgi:carbon-monoxide dehydrogenase medium subunit